MASGSAVPDPAFGSDNPWHIAKSRFLSILDPKEQDIFNNATLENLYYATSNIDRDDSEKSKTRLAVTKLGPLVSAIESYGNAFDTLSNIAPLYLAPIWGCIRVVLVVARAHSRFYKSIVETLGRIGDILPRFRDYERIYSRQKHQRLTQALSNAYLDIIVLCTQFRKSIIEQKASTVRRMLKPLSLDRQIDEAIERFRQHKLNVEEEARTCHLIEAAEQRDAQLLLWSAERRKRLLFRLSKVDCRHRHTYLAQARHEGTGLWLMTCDEYQKWVGSKNTSVLCCYGIPGCGKSVLASSVIDTLRTQITLFYYCDYADKRTLEPTNLFGTLARQTLERVDDIPEALATEIEGASHDGERLIDQSQALELFRQSLTLLNQPIHMVLDGLDEANEATQTTIYDSLRKLLKNISSSIQLFITGREDSQSQLRLKLPIIFQAICVSPTSISQDIVSYIRASIKRRLVEGSLVLQDPDLEESIARELVKGAKGMFLWVEFQLIDLCEAESDYGIKTVLQNLPRSLSETYDRLLNKIEGAERQELIRRIFKWIVCTRQPLKVGELREGIAFSLDDNEWDQNKIPTNFNRLVRACGNLVVVDKETQIVQFAHYTVQQYLLQPSRTQFHFTTQEANNMAGEFCVAYLSFPLLEGQVAHYKENANTDMIILTRLASHGALVSPDSPAKGLVRVWNALRTTNSAPLEIDMARHIIRPKKTQDLEMLEFLPYVATHWIWHTTDFNTFDVHDETQKYRVSRRNKLFSELILRKKLPFDFKPWGDLETNDDKLNDIAILGWALTTNHGYLLESAFSGVKILDREDLFKKMWQFFPVLGLVKSEQETFITHSMLNIIGTFLEEYQIKRIPEAQKLPWLYSRFLYASQKGHISAIKRCGVVEALGWQKISMIKHMMFESVVADQLLLLEFLCRLLSDNRSILPPLRVAFNGQLLNVTERAIIAGHSHMAETLFRLQYPTHTLLRDRASYFELINSSVAEGNSGRLQFLFLFLEQRGTDDGPPNVLRDITPNDPEMVNAFITAVRSGHQHIVELMLEYGVSSGSKDESGTSVLIHAIKGTHTSIVESLLRHKCSLGNTKHGLPLTVAASLGNIQIASLLISFGAETFGGQFNDKNTVALVHAYDGMETYITLSPTPLYMACYHGHQDMVELLVRAGADFNFPSPTAVIRMELVKNWQPPRITRNLYLLQSGSGGDVNIPELGHARWGYPTGQGLSSQMDSYKPINPKLKLSTITSESGRLQKFVLDPTTQSQGRISNDQWRVMEQVIFTNFLRNIDRITSPDFVSLLLVCGVNGEAIISPQWPTTLFEWSLTTDALGFPEHILSLSPNSDNLLRKTLVAALKGNLTQVVKFLPFATETIMLKDDEDGIPSPDPWLVKGARLGNPGLRKAFLEAGTLVVFYMIQRQSNEFDIRKKHSVTLQRMLNSTIQWNRYKFPHPKTCKYCEILLESARLSGDKLLLSSMLDALAFPNVLQDTVSGLDSLMFIAVKIGYPEIVRLLCKNGANPVSIRLDGSAPLGSPFNFS